METTKHFNGLPLEVKQLLMDLKTELQLSRNADFKPLTNQGNRSIVFEVLNANLIIKWLTEKGKRDSDIEALLDLDGIDYFPKLYAYQKGTFLVMEKARGKDIDWLLEHKLITDFELDMVRDQFEDAVKLGIQKGRYDWDTKLEHFFWDAETKKLKLIDFSLYDSCSSSTTQGMVKSRLETFDEMVMRWKWINNK
ncbi:hypothetical protein COL82_22475 [Bacillus toyonensis]|uniref:hypothetical protein n=1 Tax=Bacillus cereus group TaxID=86661 RepID=UPI000BF10D05|nr:MULTISPECIES: hypothetical protein [Bacillus cereus group]MBJ7932238.1 hypothetical protein [Bacillus cereus group sp. N31]PEL56331.1 hypothetical protein CN633_22660 [Bacillus toyonensis]PFZ73993.1 hypothetical protein COL82_22475 [Bacillus toyonensis]